MWSGNKFAQSPYQITDLYMCDNYGNAPHLCVTLFDGPLTGGSSKGSYSLIIDQNYHVARAVAPDATFQGQTLGQDLPEGFQTAEFLLEHGMLDAVVHRRELKGTIGQLLRHMTGKPAAVYAAS